MRPTIDRIDENGNYELKNIDVLTKRDNTLKATQKPVFVFKLNTWSFIEYPSQKIAKKEFGQGYKAIERGVAFSPDGVANFKSRSVPNEKSENKRYSNMTREEITSQIKSKMDNARKIIETKRKNA